MDLNAGRASVTEGSSSLHQDALWQRNLRSREQMESGHYPVREGEPDCSYYIRTGLCRFGETCRFNHPPNRELSYLNFGTSKFGAAYKFHQPREKAAIAGSVPLNVLGYPLRPNVAECAYYLRTGRCKFGSTCKFHHPHPSNMTINLQSSPVYTSFQSPPSSGQLSYRASFAGSSSYAPPLLPQGMLSVPGWNTYSGQLDSVSPSESNQQTTGNNQVQGTSYPYEAANLESQGTYSLYLSGSLSSGYLLQKENVFPERPGQPECQFYMKTGDCKFGAVCKFHHPKERLIPAPDCALSPIGLPLRQGEPLCSFYLRYGICKFGPSCKFDHPMEVFTSDLSASTDALVHMPLLGSSPGSGAPTFLSDDLVESGSTKLKRLSLSEVTSVSSGDNEIDAEG